MTDHDDAAYFAAGGRLAHTDWEPGPDPRPDDFAPVLDGVMPTYGPMPDPDSDAVPRPDNLDAVRAEGRRLLADLADARNGMDGDRVEDAKEAWLNFTFVHADALLAPTLTEDEQRALHLLPTILRHDIACSNHRTKCECSCGRDLILDAVVRLSRPIDVAAEAHESSGVTVRKTDSGPWEVLVDGQVVSTHTNSTAARITAKRHLVPVDPQEEP